MRALFPLTVLSAIMLLVGCVVQSTPEPTSTPVPEGEPTPIRIADTPTPPVVSTPTPQLVQLPGDRTYKRYAAPPLMTIDPKARYTALITTNLGDVTIELFASEAPITVNNFVFLAREGFYDGVPFHRVIKGFMVQTGDPRGDGTGGPGYRFKDEPVTRSYSKGIVAMANAGPNTNGSQFFIVQGDDVGLPPSYTIFGEVTSGIAIVDQIANTPVQPSASGEVSSPTQPLFVESVEITKRR